MKRKDSKFGLIFTIICNVAIVLSFIIGFYLVFFKIEISDRIDKKTFVDYMETKGCQVVDILAEENLEGFDDYLVTTEDTCPYLINYATFNDKNVLKNFFLSERNDVLENNPNARGSYNVSINTSKVQYYEYTTYGDYYKAIVYNDNSVLYAVGNKEYRDEITNIYKDLNYKYELNIQGMKIAWLSFYILLVIVIVSMWKTLKKTRNKSWISLIPFYNIGCLSKDILGSPWYALLLLLPIGNIVFMFMFYYNMGKVFSKKDFYCVLMMFFPSVLWPLLAFDDSKYIKPEKKKKEKNEQTLSQDKNVYIKNTEINSENEISAGKKIIRVTKWIFTVFFLLFGFILFVIYTDSKVISDLVMGIFFIIYGLLLYPYITDWTKKYETYTRFKPLIVIILIIAFFAIVGSLPE